MSERIEAFAQRSDIRLSAEPVVLAPRDLTASMEQSEFHYLVVLTRPGSDAAVRIVYAKPLTDANEPTAGEILWWLAGDAFAVEQSEGDLEPWAHSYGLPPRAEGTARLFDQQRKQSETLRKLLGDVGYRTLISTYASEMLGTGLNRP